jgi:sialidase-1
MLEQKRTVKISVIGVLFMAILLGGCNKQASIKSAGGCPAFEKKMAGFMAMTDQEARQYEIDAMNKIADLSLIAPKLNTDPLPEYGYENLDYAMNLGIAMTPGGRIWAVWVAGEDGPEAHMVAATSDDNGETWSNPRLVVDSRLDNYPIQRSVLVGNFWTDPLGRLWFFFDQTMNMFDGRQGVWASICENPDDDEPEWSQPVRIWHGAVLNKPTVLDNGEWLLPVEFPRIPSRGGLFENVHKELEPLRGANVLVSSDQGKSWQRRGNRRFPNRCWQEHALIELNDGRIWMLARTRMEVMQSFSSDGGKTWEEPSEPTFKHPRARFLIQRLQSGRILLVKHGDTVDTYDTSIVSNARSKLTAWVSEDEGKTWKGGLMLDERTRISYPDGFQAPDGTIYISYDRERSPLGEILMARITEEDILAGKITNPKSKLKILAVKCAASK